MSDHLPECIHTPEEFDPEQNISWDGKPCICDELRACERRIIKQLEEKHKRPLVLWSWQL